MKAMTLAEYNLDPRDGADKAWDAIHEWLDRYALEISPAAEDDLHSAIQHMLTRIKAKQLS